MRRFPRAFAVLLVALFLSGCAMPLPVQVASLIADGISWFSTDKTLSDHAISLAANKDCSVWRGFSEGSICRDNAKDGATLMAGVKVDDGEEMASADNAAYNEQSAVVSETAPTTASPFQEPPRMMPIAEIPDQPTVAEKGSLHFVLASFSVTGNAKRMVGDNPLLSPTIVDVTIDNRTMHRVVVGPFTGKERKSLAERISKAGFKDAWIVRMAPNRRPRKNHKSGSQLASAFR